MTREALRSRFLDLCRRAGVEPAPEVVAGVGIYFDLLRTWNQRINLTALNLGQPSDEDLDRLLVEPVVAASLIGADPARVVDVGSGGGSPAIPFRLALAQVSMTLVEARHKKAVFLREAIRLLGLAETRVEARRMEEWAASFDLSEHVDVVTIRAVRLDAGLLEAVRRILGPGGRLLLFGADAAEAEAASHAGFVVEAVKMMTPSAGSRIAILRKAS